MFPSIQFEVEVILCEGRELKNVNWRCGLMRPYAAVRVDDGPIRTTKIAKVDESTAVWNQTLIVPVPRPLLPCRYLTIAIVHFRVGNEEKEITKSLIGRAMLRLDQILDEVGEGELVAKTLTLYRPSGRPQGKIDVFFRIQESSVAPSVFAHLHPSQPQPVYGGPLSTPLMQDLSHNGRDRPPIGYYNGALPPVSHCQLPGTVNGEQPPFTPAPPAYDQRSGSPLVGAGDDGSMYGIPPPAAVANPMPADGAESDRNNPSRKKKKKKIGGLSGAADGAVGGLD